MKKIILAILVFSNQSSYSDLVVEHGPSHTEVGEAQATASNSKPRDRTEKMNEARAQWLADRLELSSLEKGVCGAKIKRAKFLDKKVSNFDVATYK